MDGRARWRVGVGGRILLVLVLVKWGYRIGIYRLSIPLPPLRDSRRTDTLSGLAYRPHRPSHHHQLIMAMGMYRHPTGTTAPHIPLINLTTRHRTNRPIPPRTIRIPDR
jgi:hypothetical protein